MIEEIKVIHEDSHQIYGAPKITELLRRKGHGISEKTVGRYMKESGIKAWYRKPYTVTTRDSDFSYGLKDLLKRDFSPQAPNRVWWCDITYIWTQQGFIYLTSIMDLYSRRILAWEVSSDLSVEGVVRCIEKAKQQRQYDKPIVIHSDRGSQYVSKAYQDVLGSGFERSYSRKANPWDNACIESFHALIKREWLNRYSFSDMASARRAIFEYIETFYNRSRIHSTLAYVSPIQVELLYYQAH